jgi:hypothetical protein
MSHWENQAVRFADSSAEVGEMGPNRKVVRQFALAGLTALALSTSAEAALLAFDSYGTTVTTLGSFSGTSPGISIDGLVTPFDLQTSFALAATSGTSVTLTTTGEAFQVVQGCPDLLASCDPGDWTDLPAPSGGLALGGTSFTQTFPPGTKGLVVDSGIVNSSAIDLGGAKSLRLKLTFDTISNDAANIVGTGSLAVTAIPEPGVWALMLAGILGIAGIARRRIG